MKRQAKIFTAALTTVTLAIALNTLFMNSSSRDGATDQSSNGSSEQHGDGNGNDGINSQQLGQVAQTVHSLQESDQVAEVEQPEGFDLAQVAFTEQEQDIVAQIKTIEEKLRKDRVIQRLNAGEFNAQEREGFKQAFFELNGLRANLVEVKMKTIEAKMNELEKELANG